MTETELKYDYTINTGFNDIDIFSIQDSSPPPSVLLSDRLLPYRLPGGLDIKGAQKDSSSNVQINLLESHQPSVELEENGQFNVFGPISKPEFVNQLPYIAYSLSEKKRQEEMSIYGLHAAAVSTEDGKSILILGDKGSGKTVLSLSFAMELEMGLIGNDLVSLQNRQGNLHVIAGSEVIEIRKAVLKYALPEHYDSMNYLSNPYEDKSAFIPEELGITLGKDISGLSSVVRVNLHPYNDKTTLEKGARRIQEALRLRENFGRYIKGNVTPVILSHEEFGGFFPSLDNSSLSDERDRVVEQVMDLNFVYAIGNNPRNVAQEIVNACL